MREVRGTESERIQRERLLVPSTSFAPSPSETIACGSRNSILSGLS